MRRTARELDDALLAGDGVIRRSDLCELAGSIDWAVRRGLLEAVLPGIYVRPEVRDQFEVCVRAVRAWNPDAVLCGAAAARWTFWPDLAVPVIDVAATRGLRRRGFVVTRRRIPVDLIIESRGVRATSPALTALDLSSTVGGNAIDTVLRTRAATLEHLHDAMALTPGRDGNRDRRILLVESRDRPWSEAERGLHRTLREATIVGWEGNWGWQTLTGTYWIDVAFPELKLAVEVDGREFHNTPEAFENDRARQNDLVLAGWTVLRFTAVMIRDHPEVVVMTVLAALALLSGRP